MIVVFLGPPGAGKGTQCEVVRDRYSLEHLSSGDILRRHRKEGTELGAKAQSYMDQGALVPDDLIVAMMVDEMQNVQNENGFILDGFPRTIGQAEELDKALGAIDKKVDIVLNLEVDDAKLEARVTGRRNCPVCGAGYHIMFKPPKVDNQCDKGCGELNQRSDDTADVVKSRIQNYHAQTAPLVDYYQGKGNLANIDGNVDIKEVTNSLFAVLDK